MYMINAYVYASVNTGEKYTKLVIIVRSLNGNIIGGLYFPHFQYHVHFYNMKKVILRNSPNLAQDLI